MRISPLESVVNSPFWVSVLVPITPSRPTSQPAAVVIEMAGVDSLNAAEQIRRLYPKVGLVWCCDLNFSAQAYHLDVDYFYLFSEADIGKFGIGLNRAQLLYNKRGNTL